MSEKEEKARQDIDQEREQQEANLKMIVEGLQETQEIAKDMNTVRSLPV